MKYYFSLLTFLLFLELGAQSFSSTSVSNDNNWVFIGPSMAINKTKDANLVVAAMAIAVQESCKL